MTPRSVYRGRICPHCGRRIGNGRAFIGATFYVDPSFPSYIRTQRAPLAHQSDREVEMRVAYHRVCVEAVLAKSPLDPEQSIEQLHEYRERLLDRYGIDEVTS